MTQEDDPPEADGGGFDADDWSRLKAFRPLATLDDVEAGRAVFALADTLDARPIDMDLPQPLIWWEDDAPAQAAVAIQAETHRVPDGEAMEVLGLILPDGSSAVALMDDVDLVDDTDPTWRDLVAGAVGESDDR